VGRVWEAVIGATLAGGGAAISEPPEDAIDPLREWVRADSGERPYELFAEDLVPTTVTTLSTGESLL
jgi:hypothetical protein